MYLSILRLWNFRKYAGADNKPGLEIHFQKGVNVLIGENDSGKTAIVDAIRYVLRTQSGEFIQFEDKDFYQDSDGNRKDEFKINFPDGEYIHIDYHSKDKCRTFQINPDRSVILVKCSLPELDFTCSWDEKY